MLQRSEIKDADMGGTCSTNETSENAKFSSETLVNAALDKY